MAQLANDTTKVADFKNKGFHNVPKKSRPNILLTISERNKNGVLTLLKSKGYIIDDVKSQPKTPIEASFLLALYLQEAKAEGQEKANEAFHEVFALHPDLNSFKTYISIEEKVKADAKKAEEDKKKKDTKTDVKSNATGDGITTKFSLQQKLGWSDKAYNTALVATATILVTSAIFVMASKQ